MIDEIRSNDHHRLIPRRTANDTYVWYTAEERTIAKAFDEKLQQIRLLILSMDDVLLLQPNHIVCVGQVLRDDLVLYP